MKIKTALLIVFTLIAMLILADYSLSTTKTTESVIALNNTFESYFNAAGNSHYSHKIETENYNFNISDEYYELVNIGDKLTIYESPIFKEINASKIVQENYSETYSLRRISGLFIPVLMLVVVFFSFKNLDKFKILTFVTVIVSISNLIYLIL